MGGVAMRSLIHATWKTRRAHAAVLANVIAATLALGSDAFANERAKQPTMHDLAAKDTLAVVRMNHGDTLRYRLKSGETRTFVLQETSAHIVERVRGGIVYSFECTLLADGQPIRLRRFVCSQETFYEPWVVNGVRLWFSSSQAIFKLVPIRYPDQHDPLDVDAVLALQDATLPICPQPIQPWFPIERHFIDVGQCYNGDDPWLGPYLGQACHMGLDINMPKGTPLYAPLDFDDHWIFSADHRWRGVRRWPNGDIWALQSHHVNQMLVPERGRLKSGTHYGEAAGKGIGSHQHSHFEFRLGEGVLNRGQLGGTEVDPWILFWQIFENDRAEKGLIRAEIDPVSPASTGQGVMFAASRSRGGPQSQGLRYYWTFGDGGSSHDPAPTHTFVRPGIYPVTLVIDDGHEKATHTQHITVYGEPVKKPALALAAHSTEPSFRPRPLYSADAYGTPVTQVPHTLRFVAAPWQTGADAPPAKAVWLRNQGAGQLPVVDTPQVHYQGEKQGWLRYQLENKDGQDQRLMLTVDAAKAGLGNHEAAVEVNCPGAINGRQVFRVEFLVRPMADTKTVVVDDRDEGFYAPPCVWVGHQFLRCPERGHNKRYLSDGGRSEPGHSVVITPDLTAGRYEIRLPEDAVTGPATLNCYVRPRGADGPEHLIALTPEKTAKRVLGVFDFSEGNAGTIEIVPTASDGNQPAVVDALEFRRLGDR